MAQFYYTKTIVYTQTVEADTQEAADAIALEKEVTDNSVSASDEGWQEDGYAD
jgi:hypothetical protein